MSCAPDSNAMVDKPATLAVGGGKPSAAASTSRRLKTQPNPDPEQLASDKAAKVAKPSSNKPPAPDGSLKKRSASGLAGKQSPFLQNIYKIYEGMVAQERKSNRASKPGSDKPSTAQDLRCRDPANHRGLDPPDTSIVNSKDPAGPDAPGRPGNEGPTLHTDSPLDTIHEIGPKLKKTSCKKPEQGVEGARGADKKDRKAAATLEKDLATSPQTHRHVALLFGSKADNFRQKLLTENSKTQLSKTIKNTKPFYETASNKVSKRSVEKFLDSPSKPKRESPSKPSDAHTPEPAKPANSNDFGNFFYLHKNCNKPNLSKETPSNCRSKFASVARVNRKSNNQHHLLKTRSQVYDDTSSAKNDPGLKEPKDKSDRLQSRQKSATNLRTVGTFSKKDLEKSAGRVSKELSCLSKTPSQVFSRPKTQYSETLKSSQTHYRDSYKFSKDISSSNTPYLKKDPQKNKPDQNPGLRLIQDLGFVEHVQGKDDLLGGSTAETVKKPHQKAGCKKEKFEAKRRETQSESEQFKRDFSNNFKALMDMKGLKKHVMAMKASSHQKIVSLFKTAHSIDPELYYLYHLFQACKHSLEGGSGEEEKDKDKLKALEHYSQNVIGFSQTKSHRARSLSDYIAKRFELSNYKSTRMTLLFDLDETLAHCQQVACTKAASSSPCPKSGVTIRPFVFEVISELKRYFEVGLFTSSTKEYADAIIKIFDSDDQLFDFRLYRDSCVDIGGGLVAKDLRVIKDRDAQSLFIVDNNTFCFGFQLNQGIPILPFTGDAKDKELIYLLKYLKFLAAVSEPSRFNCRYFGHDLLQSHSDNISILPRLMLERIVEISDSVHRQHL
jgi:Dullard-like phosphatase family protein